MKVKEFKRVNNINSNSFDLKKIIKLQRPNNTHNKFPNPVDKFVKQKRALGELDHPESSVVNLQNVSHNVTEMHWEGDNLVGTVEVLGTPSGNILKELFKAGIKLGISSRGMGSVQPMQEGDGQTVGKDFELIAFDFVSNPSTHGAFLYPLKESVGNEVPVGRTCGEYCKVESIINDIIREG